MQNPEIEFLVKLGIPEKGAEIYAALLEMGDGGISDIARRTELYRADIYHFLPLLLEKHLVSEIRKGKRSFYRAGDPAALQALCDEFIVNSSVMLQRLKTKHEAKSLKAQLTHLKGVESIAKIYTDAVRLTPAGENYLRYSSGNRIYDRSIYSSSQYASLKKQKNIGRLVIANSLIQKRKLTNDPSREIVEIPKDFELFEDNISKLIYGDRVAIIDHDLLEAFVIESSRFAEYERKIFHYLWKLLRERKS